MSHVPSNAGCKYPVEVPTREEVNAVLKLCSRRAPSGIRNRALLVTLYRSGLRVQEALDLLPKDIDFAAATINVRSGKGGKQRIVGVDDGALGAIEAWMTKRSTLGVTAKQPLFCQITRGREGRPLHQQVVRDVLNRLGARAGIDKRLHCHALRHACASEMVAEGFDLSHVQAQLGHSSLTITQRYIAKIAPHQLASAMKARTWAAS